MTIGPLMLDLEGKALSQQEKEILRHPKVGGIILFSKNYESKKQLRDLIQEIRLIKSNLIIAVDQEGGRVQRFREEFQPLPTFKTYGERYQQNPVEALLYAQQMATQMAKELLEIGIDISFTPVLDIDRGVSEVIGDRSFYHQSEEVIAIARAFIQGMHAAGMPATGKHFPGHGAVAADSHHTLPIDERNYDEIYQDDMQPFIALHQELDAIMPAHILYKAVDPNPTCFSNFWLETILRNKLNFNGVIFSDDLTMAGAEIAGDFIERSHKALRAGCDMILICHQPMEAIAVLESLENYHNPVSTLRLNNFISNTRRTT